MLNNVLIIDDDEITLMICEIFIEKEKFAKRVIKLKNGQEGVDYFHRLEAERKQGKSEQAPELILLDLHMPLLNGWEFLEEFESRYEQSFPDVKVCILTSSVDSLDLTYSKIHNNVIGFINKPLTVERISEIKENERLAHLFDTN